MTDQSSNERRRHERFETDLRVEFCVPFDLETKLDYQVKDQVSGSLSQTKYSGVSRNVSAEGISFFSPQKLNSGDGLFMEIYVPSSQKPVRMEGEVRWSESCGEENRLEKAAGFLTGVKVSTVEGSLVERSIIIDPYHKILWSVVLESVFGSFKHLMLQRKGIGTRD